MNRIRIAAILLLAGLAALPATAQIIPPGEDPWVTAPDGQTKYSFPPGDVESLCGAPTSSTWDHSVALRGIPVAGFDYDTTVKRIDTATFDTTGNAWTRVVVTRLDLASMAPQVTPCGDLSWRVRLAGPQAITKMNLVRTSTAPIGGVFSADIAVNVEFQGYRGGTYVGSLFYNLILPDPANGTPWSFGPKGNFRPGITTADNCIDVLRAKLAITTDPRHRYRISDMIAQGICTDRG